MDNIKLQSQIIYRVIQNSWAKFELIEHTIIIIFLEGYLNGIVYENTVEDVIGEIFIVAARVQKISCLSSLRSCANPYRCCIVCIAM